MLIKLTAKMVNDLENLSKEPVEKTAIRLIREGIAVEQKINSIGKPEPPPKRRVHEEISTRSIKKCFK